MLEHGCHGNLHDGCSSEAVDAPLDLHVVDALERHAANAYL